MSTLHSSMLAYVCLIGMTCKNGPLFNVALVNSLKLTSVFFFHELPVKYYMFIYYMRYYVHIVLVSFVKLMNVFSSL